MSSWDLKSSPVLRVERFQTIDQFHSSGVLGEARTVLIDRKTFSASRAALALPNCRLVVQRTFARVFEGELGAEQCGLVVPMSEDHYHTANGQAVTGGGVLFLRGTISCRVDEPHPNTHSLIRLSSKINMRDWSDLDNGLSFMAAEPQRMLRLQKVIAALARNASTCTDGHDFAVRARSMQETLYAALDDIMLQQDGYQSRSRSFERHNKIVARIDEFIELRPTIAVYSEDLAITLGISIRTLQAATMTVHGIPLHRYIRMKKLWMVRRLLTVGHLGINIKAAAISNGFWHMGEFSRNYRASFGELPSETLMRARS
ncbi:AraC family transcriptional regulator [Bradyrhizobium japonicum]|uniref:AraC family transcriptional regulator n=1 Tax=Bradyrhizobium japonicum TaxID=375 RepID=UPI000488E9D0|nr:AraC family transcriptional regulator [Bradyrhizobium japonicum]